MKEEEEGEVAAVAVAVVHVLALSYIMSLAATAGEKRRIEEEEIHLLIIGSVTLKRPSSISILTFFPNGDP